MKIKILIILLKILLSIFEKEYFYFNQIFKSLIMYKILTLVYLYNFNFKILISNLILKF